MLILLGGWWFASFLYFKIILDAVFGNDLSIFGAIILGVIMALVVFVFSAWYAMRLLPYNWTPGAVPVGLSTVVGRTLVPFFVALVGAWVIFRLVIFGFSKDLDQELRFTNWRGEIADGFYYFLFWTALPVLLHYVMCVFATYVNANRQTPR